MSKGVNMKRLIIISGLSVLSCSYSWALELNFCGRETRIPTGRIHRKERPLSVSLRSQFYDRSISGDVVRSLGEERPHYQNLVGISYRRAFGRNFLKFRADLRNSDDPMLQKGKLELLGFDLTFGRERGYRFKVGDVYLRGGRYTFRRSARGISYSHNLRVTGGRLKLQAGYGRLYEGIEGIRFARFLSAGGLGWERRVGKFLVKGLKLDFGYARTWDDEGSIEHREGLGASKNGVFSIGAEVRFDYDLNLKLELARSWFRDGFTGEVKDKAISLGLEKGFSFGNLRASFEEVGPKFRSLSGSGFPDTRRMSAYMNARLGRKVTLFGGFNFYRNNLDGRKDVTTEALSQNISANYRPLRMLWFSSNINWNSHRAGDDLNRWTLGQNHRISAQVKGWNMSVAYRHHMTEDKLADDRRGGGLRLSASHPNLVGRVVGRFLKGKPFRGGIALYWDTRKDGLKGETANRWTSIGFNSSGTVGKMSYSGGVGWEKAKLSGGESDYREFTWNISLSYVLVVLQQSFEFGVMLDGSNNRDAAPDKSYSELATRVQIHTLF
ncbi:MAG: hypothetical protein DRP95_00345 [Candidatus Latescibacterota bacterium]|nr:MAG: hypothetical protein DRP95_00345 [Candidatus Latescibacterota bacterium]